MKRESLHTNRTRFTYCISLASRTVRDGNQGEESTMGPATRPPPSTWQTPAIREVLVKSRSLL